MGGERLVAFGKGGYDCGMEIRVVTGLLNKQIADQLGTSEASVKVHRQHAMEKMRAGSLAALVRMADRIGPPPPKS